MENNRTNRQFLASKAIDSLSLKQIFNALINELSDRYSRDLDLFQETAERLGVESYTKEQVDEFLNRKPLLMLAPDDKTSEDLSASFEDLFNALQSLVNYLESDPDLYDGDDDGAMGRVMQGAYDVLATPNLEPTHYNCCHAPKDLGHMFGCPNSPENKRGEADLLDAVEHVLIASEDGGDMNDIDWDLLRSVVARVKGGE